MPDTKISALTALTAPAPTDELVVVDKSDTSMAASGTTKSLQRRFLADQGPVPEGGQKTATGKTVRVPNWQPGTVIGNPGARQQGDVLFAPVVQNEREVLEQGGRLANSYLFYFTSAKAALAAGPNPAGQAVDVVTTVHQHPVFQLDGILPLDEWTIEVPILSVGADLTAQPTGTRGILNIVSQGIGTVGSDEIRLYRSGTAIIEARYLLAGTSVALAQITLVAGEVPADTWKVLSLTFKKSQALPLRLMLGNNTRVSSSGTGSAETGPGATVISQYPMSGFLVQNFGLALGSLFGSTVSTILRVGMPTIRRNQMVYNAPQNVKTPTVAIDPNTTSGAMPDTCGMLWQYQGWTPTGQDSSTSIRNQIAAMECAAGLKRARIEHIIDKAIITGTIASPVYDWTPLWNIMDPLFNAGCTKFDLTLGYTPTLLGATQATVPSDTDAFAIYCRAFMDAAATRYGTAALASWSLWNEPDLTTFWLGTSAQMVTLWQAVHTQLAAAYPNTLIGATENSAWSAAGGSSTITRAIIDQAATDGRRLDHIRVHDYTADLGLMRRIVADIQAYFATKATNGSFTANASIPVAITEWNWALQDYGQYESGTAAYSAYREPASRTERLAGFAYAYAVEMIAAGCPFSSFTRGGITTAGSPNGAEAHLGAFTIDDPPARFPFSPRCRRCGNSTA